MADARAKTRDSASTGVVLAPLHTSQSLPGAIDEADEGQLPMSLSSHAQDMGIADQTTNQGRERIVTIAGTDTDSDVDDVSSYTDQPSFQSRERVSRGTVGGSIPVNAVQRAYVSMKARSLRAPSSLSTRLFGGLRRRQGDDQDSRRHSDSPTHVPLENMRAKSHSQSHLPSVSQARGIVMNSNPGDDSEEGIGGRNSIVDVPNARPSFARLINASKQILGDKKEAAILEGRFAESSLFFVKGVISPNSLLKRAWNLILFLTVLYNTLLLPFYCSFRIVFTVTPPSLQFLISYLCDAFWIADIVFNFYTGFFEEGLLVTERRRIRRKYLKGTFVIDVLAAIPLDIFAVIVGTAWLPFLRLNKMLQFYRTNIYTKEIERALRLNANVASLVRLLVMFAVFVHWCGCVFFYIGVLQREVGVKHTWVDEQSLWNLSFFDQWLVSVYWSLTCMTTVGFGDIHPITTTEMQYVIFVELLGVSVYATAFGNMTAMIQNMDFTGTAFRRKVDTVTEYMKFRKLNPSLRKRVLSYYDVVWSRHKGLDENSILNDLPTSLRAEISLVLNRELVMSVPLFKDCLDPGFINSLVVMLVPVTALPGDYVVRYGEIGREMYFVRRGQLNIMSKDGQTMFAQMKDGQYFGEVALLDDVRRTASVRAATYCDLLVLTKEDFERVMQFYPDYDVKIRQTAQILSSGYRHGERERPGE